MNPELYTKVLINRDFPEFSLIAGDTAIYIELLPHPQGAEAGAILELFNALGESLGIATVPFSAIEPLRETHIPTVRERLG